MENKSFEKGYNTGVDNLDHQASEESIQAYSKFDYLIEELDFQKARLQRVDDMIQETQNQRTEWLNAKLEIDKKTDISAHKVAELEQDIEKNKKEIEHFTELKNDRKTPYAMLAGLLYLLAGAAFVAGDLIISHEIVAYALNIRNNFEAWAFAVGLASLSILLKPAYERLIEQPYLQNKDEKIKKSYGRFQTFLVVVSMGTLIVLGWFRYEAYRTDKLKDAINKEIKSLQLAATPIDPTVAPDNTALIQQIDAKLAQYNALNLELVNSPWALMSFVLSGVLFALAGAICLGIAFPILQAYWFRNFQAAPAIARRNRRLKKLKVAFNENKEEYLKAFSEQSHFNTKLEELPKIDALRANKDELERSISELRNQIHDANADRQLGSFREGYEKGRMSRQEMTDQEYENYRKQNVGLVGENEDITAKTPRTYRSNGLRPHQALRKVITEGFNDN